MSDSDSRDDFIYYNITDTNSQQGTITEADFQQTRPDPILVNPSEYEIAVVRFSLPVQSVDLFQFRDNYWSVALSYGGNIYQEYVQFIPFSTNPDDKSIFTYNDFINMMNVAYQAAFDALKAANPLAPQTLAPVFKFDPTTRLFSVYVPEDYTTAPPDTVLVYYNWEVATLFGSLGTPFENGYPENTLTTFNLRPELYPETVQNLAWRGGASHYCIAQEFETTSEWNSLRQILFEVGSLPVDGENLPFRSIPFGLPEDEVRELRSKRAVLQRILTDFEPLASEQRRTRLQYFPQGPLRWYGLQSEKPLYRIDCKASWVSTDGTKYPILLNNQDQFTLKVLFRRKARGGNCYDPRLDVKLNCWGDECLDEVYNKLNGRQQRQRGGLAAIR